MKRLRCRTRPNMLYNGSFQESIGPILAMAQCFGLMPVVGIKSNSASQLRFKWRSFRTLYSFVVFLLLTAYTVMSALILVQNKIQLIHILPLVFSVSVAFGMYCFLKLAFKWPRLMRRWESIEAKMPNYCTDQEKKKLSYHVKMLSIVVLVIALVEHSLATFSTFHFSKICLRQDDPLKESFILQLSQLFTFLPYSILTVFLGKFVHIVATFIWSYMDLFIMIMSIGISSRFKQINDELERIKGEDMPEEFWALRRLQYRKLCNLCFMVDDAISQLTMISFANNLFFVCVQLFRSIRPKQSAPHAIYFWFSLIFVLSRTLAVSLYSSEIHDESKKPINVLRAVPSHSWCIEVRRFAEHVVNDTIALTGMKFFFLTRKLILSVIGTIITYELVLIQFHTDDYRPVECQNAT